MTPLVRLTCARVVELLQGGREVKVLDLAESTGASECCVLNALTELERMGAPLERSKETFQGHRRVQRVSLAEPAWQMPFRELAPADRLAVVDRMLAEMGFGKGDTRARLTALREERERVASDLGEVANGRTLGSLVDGLRADLAGALAGQKVAVDRVHTLDVFAGRVWRLVTEGSPGDGVLPANVELDDVLVAISDALGREQGDDILIPALCALLLGGGRRVLRMTPAVLEALDREDLRLTLTRTPDGGFFLAVRADGEQWCSSCGWTSSCMGRCSSCGAAVVDGPLADPGEVPARFSEANAGAVLGWLEVMAQTRPEVFAAVETAKQHAATSTAIGACER